MYDSTTGSVLGLSTASGAVLAMTGVPVTISLVIGITLLSTLFAFYLIGIYRNRHPEV